MWFSGSKCHSLPLLNSYPFWVTRKSTKEKQCHFISRVFSLAVNDMPSCFVSMDTDTGSSFTDMATKAQKERDERIKPQIFSGVPEI